ncbi:dTDP-4-dehydrorhamnose 3,5-epimerase [Salinisphaera sp.]|uniref:dTDP-4-dehydrorhamnose 3,5-epimerase n=1 Tax=Salinisphaera sp. TaxID=1914330 RepID=UPI000C5DE8B4|nr:dTDP-4-dehydrorhamnose 3,5-epimerase [Salinisphaera sp.]MAS08608.1 dTDP-4-dehydrorhamnose 3,5-epimerase [Salinisphaera sp.]|tara:strand:+ start:8910 stop:9455 length:546 start_codon:yes stop_codon:yes gene_type:complete
MNVIDTEIPDVKLIEPKVFGDERGFFMESWNRRTFAEAGLDFEFVQDNHSRSVQHTLRGLHYQVERPQGKLVRVTRGAVFDVAVDIRPSSQTRGKWVGKWLTEENQCQLWIPPGFAHGFYVSSKVADFQYKCTDYYFSKLERCIRWDDATLGIEWPRFEFSDLNISKKDQEGANFDAQASG